MFVGDSPDWHLNFDDSDICEECEEAPAVVHLVRVEDGAVTHVHLCQSCAEELAEQTAGMALVLSITTSYPGKMQKKRDAFSKRSFNPDTQICTVCGTTLADIQVTGKVGCSICYQVFADHLRNTLQGDMEMSTHLGKVPHKGSEKDGLRMEVMRLRNMLRELVDHERFEEAASVRDRLTELGQNNPEGA